MNALHLEAHFELKEIWEDFRDDPDVWVAILTGAGERAFSAGQRPEGDGASARRRRRRPGPRATALRPDHA